MANHLRFRSGPVQLIKASVDVDSVIEPGDLLYLDSGDARPASEFGWDTNLATTQAAFADAFLGIAHERSAAGDTDLISVDISPQAVYEFDVDASTYGLGDLLGPDEASSSLMTQQLESVATAARAIARVVELSSVSVSKARVTFASAFSTGSANANAQIG
jgi:hypothetical protein